MIRARRRITIAVGTVDTGYSMHSYALDLYSRDRCSITISGFLFHIKYPVIVNTLHRISIFFLLLGVRMKDFLNSL